MPRFFFAEFCLLAFKCKSVFVVHLRGAKLNRPNGDEQKLNYFLASVLSISPLELITSSTRPISCFLNIYLSYDKTNFQLELLKTVFLIVFPSGGRVFRTAELIFSAYIIL